MEVLVSLTSHLLHFKEIPFYSSWDIFIDQTTDPFSLRSNSSVLFQSSFLDPIVLLAACRRNPPTKCLKRARTYSLETISYASSRQKVRDVRTKKFGVLFDQQLTWEYVAPGRADGLFVWCALQRCRRGAAPGTCYIIRLSEASLMWQKPDSFIRLTAASGGEHLSGVLRDVFTVNLCISLQFVNAALYRAFY